MTPANLPHQPTPFIGRGEELAALATRLADPNCRLVTVLGPGGIGKTRLALQVADDQGADLAEGVCFVPLAPVGSPDLLATAIADALQISFYGSEAPNLQLTRYLRERELLLVLDNFEHLLAGVDLLTQILDAAPAVKLLVTSRERLNVQEEWVFELTGLAFPKEPGDAPLESYSAVQLFIQRAHQMKSSFSLSDNQEAVQTICQRVEGMPLGLELAATWLRAMACDQIAVQMTRSLDLLTTPLRNVPERHRSLRAVFEQSWSLLSEAEREVLKRLSIFRGGFDLEAAEQVAGASLPILASLADKSLVRLNADSRYDLHELLRQFAADKLSADEISATADRHLAHFLKLAEQADTHNFGREQILWYDRLEANLDNLRAALAWSMQSEAGETGLRLAAALGWFLTERGHCDEGLGWFEQLLDLAPAAPIALRAKALYSAAAVAGLFPKSEQARVHGQQALALARSVNDRLSMAWALCHLANYGAYDIDQSTALLDESLALFRALDDPMGICHTLIRRMWCARAQHDFPAARRLVEEASARAQAVGDVIMSAWSADAMGTLFAVQEDDLQHAALQLEMSLSLFRQARFHAGVGNALSTLASVEQAMGHLPRAQTLYQDALRLYGEWYLHMGIGNFSLVGLASVAQRRGQRERAAILLGAIRDSGSVYMLAFVSPLSMDKLLAEAARRPMTEFEQFYHRTFNYENALAAVRAGLSEHDFSQAFAVGQAMSDGQVLQYALEGRNAPSEPTSPSAEIFPVERSVPGTHQLLTEPLSERELDVLRLIAEGASNREIAQQLVIGMSTVKKHINHIFGKLGVETRDQAIAQAHALNLL